MSALAEVWKGKQVVADYLSRRRAIPFVEAQIGVMLDVFSAGGASVSRFLDLGCGDGVLGAAMLARFPRSRGVLLDFSEPMLAQAKEILADEKACLDFVLADYALPAWLAAVEACAPFDAIVSGYSIHHQPDARERAVYGEVFSLLSPGGWFVNIEHVAPAAAITTEIFESHFIDHAFAAEKARGTGRTRAQVAEEFHRRPDKAANILAPVDAQCSWLRAAGFEEVDCFFKVHELAVFGGRRPL